MVTPFLPGDSLLFAVGTFAAIGALDLVADDGAAAAWPRSLGDAVNYAIGARVGPAVFRRDDVRFLNRKHLERTHEFYERYGADHHRDRALRARSCARSRRSWPAWAA